MYIHICILTIHFSIYIGGGHVDPAAQQAEHSLPEQQRHGAHRRRPARQTEN